MLFEKKNNSSNKTDDLFKNFAYLYYNSQPLPDYQEMLNKKLESLELSESSSEKKEKDMKDIIEAKVKSKYNLLIPAIYMELKSDSLEFKKEDLKNVIFFSYNF